jgi:signal transduction histidine kinase
MFRVPFRLQPTFATAVAALVGGIVVVVFLLEPDARQSWRSMPLLASFETAAALAAMLAAHLLGGRSQRTRDQRDLTLACGFWTLALGNLAFSAIPAAASYEAPFTTWAQALSALAGGMLLAYAVLGPAGVAGPLRFGRWTALVTGLAVGVAIAALAALITGTVDPGFDPEVPPRDAPLFDAHPLLVGLQAAAAACFAAAAVGAARLATTRYDPLLAWFAAGVMLGAAARVTYACVPPSANAWVSSGDLLRVSFYLLLIVGAALEISQYQRRLVRAAVTDERRRIARDVHDGLAQDLSLITFTAEQLDADRDGSDGEVTAIRMAARRAVVESRALLETLLDEASPPGATLAGAVRQVAALYGLEASCRIDPDAPSDPATCREFERITIEALHNAARHGRARSVDVSLTRADRGVVLRIADDGDGFDRDKVSPGRQGYGLTSMRDRASALGGHASIESSPGAGTSVEIVIP